MVITENRYEEVFDSLSIDNIKTYMINHDSSLTYMSEGDLSDYICVEELIVRHQKAEMMRIYTWTSKEEVVEDNAYDNTFNRDVKYTFDIVRRKRRRKKEYYKTTYSPLTLTELNREFFQLEYRFIGELKKVDIEDTMYDISRDLGELNIKSLNINLADIREAYIYDDSYLIVINNKIYKIYSEGGTGYGEGLVCYRDINKKTFGNKRFNFYHEELKEFIPKLDRDKYINNLNHFLFDKDERDLIVISIEENKYLGIKNILSEFYRDNENLANKIYQSIFEEAFSKNEIMNRGEIYNSRVKYMQEYLTQYTVSYNYAVILINKIIYVVFWDNY